MVLNEQNLLVDYPIWGVELTHTVVGRSLAIPADRPGTVVVRSAGGKRSYQICSERAAKSPRIPKGATTRFPLDETNQIADVAPSTLAGRLASGCLPRLFVADQGRAQTGRRHHRDPADRRYDCPTYRNAR